MADEVETETMMQVSCRLVGEEAKIDPREWFGKRRSDEEDFWEEKARESVEKAETEQQSLPEDRTRISPDEILDPPMPLSGLVTAYEESNSLRQNVDAMVTNIDGFGFMLNPSVDFNSPEFRAMVEDALEEAGEVPEGETSVPTPENVDREIKKHKRLAAKEKRRAKAFFAYCADESFIELRRSSREDLEVLGNWTWEVLRDDEGGLRRFVLVPFYTMRLTKKGDPVEIEVKRKIDAITYKAFTERKRFRKFVQRVGQKQVWFKEFGDPRPMSRKTGEYFKTEAELETKTKDDPDEGPATEILHYKIRAVRGAYGLPRWMGNLLSVLGSRLAEEVNFYYFRNKAIPPMIIFVENGRLQDSAVDRLADFMNQVKGDTEKFWKIAILEGESAEDARKRGVTWTGQPRFKIVRLSSEQLKDALFQEYDANNRDKVGEGFRMPRLLRGDVRDFNRATASTAKAFAEEQIFQPERDRFDAWIERVIGPELDMKYWRLKSLAPIVRDPFSLTEMVRDLVKVGVLVPEEGRQIAEDIFNRDFKEIEEEWVKRPLVLTIAGITKRFPETPDLATAPLGEVMKKQEIRALLGLGEPGSPVDIEGLTERLLELRHVLAKAAVLPDTEGEDPEGP